MSRDVRGVEEAQGVQVAQAGPLSQQGIDVRQTGPLPAGGAGQNQRQRRTFRLTEGLLLPQQTLVLHRQPAQVQHTQFSPGWKYMFHSKLSGLARHL